MDCSGFGTFRGPVFRGESYAPELRARRGKLETDFGFVASHGPEKHNVAFLFLGCARVLQMNGRAADHASLQENERAVRVDGERFCFFFEIGALCVSATQLNRYLHEHALAAATRTGMGRYVWRLGHASSLKQFSQTWPRLLPANPMDGLQNRNKLQ